MTTLCRAYTSESDARAAVDRLLAAGVPGGDVRVLMGTTERDARDEQAGAFAGGAAGDAVGTFADDAAARRDGMGTFAGDAGVMRAGGFADADRDTVTSYPAGVARVRVTAHRGLARTLVASGLDEAAAEADVRALHEGRILVLVLGLVGEPADAERALDAVAA
jgi:hypothetical protein